MDTLKKLNYLFDSKLKLRAVSVLVLILIGGVAELAGVSIILPIISLATDESALNNNEMCRIIKDLAGTDDSRVVLLILIFLIILIYILKNTYLAWMTHRMNCFSKGVMKHFSTRLLSSYMKQPYAYFLNKNTAEILRSVNSDTVNLYGVVANVMQVISQGTTALLLIIFSIMTNPGMTCMVALLLGSCAVIIVFGIQKRMREMGKEHQKVSAYIIQYAKQAFEGIKEVKIMNKEQYFIEQYAAVYEKSSELERICNLLSNIPKYMIETVCIVGIMIYLGIAVLSGGELAALVPQLAVFAAASFRLLPSVNALYTNFSNMIYHKASIDVIYHDIKEVENVETDFNELIIEKKSLKFGTSIEVSDVTFTYAEQEQAVLEHVNVSIRKGEAVAFVGESGGGKTTLVDIILGLLTPQVGHVYADGEDIGENVREWHTRVGYIPQVIFLLDDTIRRNIAFGIKDNEVDEERVWQVLREAQLEEFVNNLPKGLDTMTGEAGTRLSGGQRQRIGIARALYSNPDVLIFDEATSALDNETEKEVMEAIESLHGSKTMIMIAHRLTTIENCDHVYRVGNQRIEKIR